MEDFQFQKQNDYSSNAFNFPVLSSASNDDVISGNVDIKDSLVLDECKYCF